MSASNGIIRNPVTTTDVGTTLQTSSRDVGTLCSSVKINMWSRFKPVSLINQPAPNRSTEWWKAWDGTCNIILPESKNTYSDVRSTITTNGSNGYGYRIVAGGSREPYRLADFDKYKHDANPPITAITPPDEIMEGEKLNVACIRPTPDTDKTQPSSLLMEDIQTINGSTFADYYFGIMLENSEGKIVGRATTTSPNSYSVDFNMVPTITPGNYTIYCFLSSVQLPQDSIDQAGIFYAVPACPPKAIRVVPKEQAVRISVVARYIALNNDPTQKTAITYTLSVVTDIAPQNLNGNYIEMRLSTSQPGDALVAGEQREDLEDFYVSSTAWTHFGRFTINTSQRDKSFYLYVSLGGGRFTGTFSPLMSAD